MVEKIPVEWDNIETVFLDMDGTLLDLHYDNHFWLEHLPIRYAETHQITLTEAKQHLSSNYTKHHGTLNWYCIDHWAEQLKLDIPSLKLETASRIQIRQNVELFLDYLRQQGKHIILLTNAHPKTVAIKFDHTNIGKCFDQVITSHDLGLAKEQQGFWDKVHEVLDFNKQSSLFIDDNLDVLRAAEQHGVKHLLAIHQPDSQQDAVDTEEFTAIECFTQLI